MDNPEIPDYVPVRYVWRAFQPAWQDSATRRPVLRGMANQLWDTSYRTAECFVTESHVPHDHEVPAENCTCGIYGYFEPAEVWNQYMIKEIHYYDPGSKGYYAMNKLTSPILAKCSFWGRAIMGDRGIRVQHIQIEKAYIIEGAVVGIIEKPRVVGKYPDGEQFWNDELLALYERFRLPTLRDMITQFPDIEWVSVRTKEELTTLLA